MSLNALELMKSHAAVCVNCKHHGYCAVWIGLYDYWAMTLNPPMSEMAESDG